MPHQVRFRPTVEVREVHANTAPHHHHHHHRHRHREPKSTNAIPDFRFCIELGLVLRSRQFNHLSAINLLDELSERLTNKVKITNHIEGDKSESHRDWTLSTDKAIAGQSVDYKFGIRLISPFWRFSNHTQWMRHMRDVMGLLDHSFEVTTTHQCSTRVHVVPDTGFWTTSQAKALAKSAIYFERCFDALVPPYRRRSVWAKSNRYNHHMAGMSTAECLASIESQETLPQLAATMNWCAANSATGDALGRTSDFVHDTFRWNFSNLVDGDHFGTIEFRQPPGATSSSNVISWIMMVVCFARLSCTYGNSIQPQQKASLDSLGEWILYEAECSGVPHKSLLRDLLSSAQPLKGKEASYNSITFGESDRLVLKDKERSITKDKYNKLVKHLIPR
ncbi:putative amidoligase enzyme-domain-containing protein [Podospora didyma]|uniref:Amidoligase enzyme-domain-containing protein n=1 Tax=Podospora didyma TaxID=330526 RepID=A0AAE0P4N1_9PEZI|nr:putative amidoligase enzyme-domain-containing protein [Podospora didyma]